MRRSVLAFLFSLSFAAWSSADDYPRNPAIDAIHYRLHVTINDSNEEIQARSEILFEFKSDGVKTIPLDMAGLSVDWITEKKRETTFTRLDGKFTIALIVAEQRAGQC